jgi:hypothetical protein
MFYYSLLDGISGNEATYAGLA